MNCKLMCTLLLFKIYVVESKPENDARKLKARTTENSTRNVVKDVTPNYATWRPALPNKSSTTRATATGRECTDDNCKAKCERGGSSRGKCGRDNKCKCGSDDDKLLKIEKRNDNAPLKPSKEIEICKSASERCSNQFCQYKCMTLGHTHGECHDDSSCRCHSSAASAAYSGYSGDDNSISTTAKNPNEQPTSPTCKPLNPFCNKQFCTWRCLSFGRSHGECHNNTNCRCYDMER